MTTRNMFASSAPSQHDTSSTFGGYGGASNNNNTTNKTTTANDKKKGSANKKKAQHHLTPEEKEARQDAFDNLSRIAATHAATRIRDATMRLLSIWYENVSNKLLGALDVPARHLEDFQQGPNEESLTSFMDSFIAAHEVVKEQMVDEDDDSDDGKKKAPAASGGASLGPRGNPFEINNRLFELFVQTIADAIGSTKVAIDEEEEDDGEDAEESEVEEDNTNANGISQQQPRDYDSVAPPLQQTQAPIAETQQQQQNPPQQHQPYSAAPTPNREWNQLTADNTPNHYQTQPQQQHDNYTGGAPQMGGNGGGGGGIYGNNAPNYAAMAPPPHHHSSATASNVGSTAPSDTNSTQDRSISSYLLAKRQKRLGVAGKVGIGGANPNGGIDNEDEVALPSRSSRAGSVGVGVGGGITPRYSSSAAGHNNIFGGPTNQQTSTPRLQQQPPNQHHHDLPRGRAHPQYHQNSNNGNGSGNILQAPYQEDDGAFGRQQQRLLNEFQHNQNQQQSSAGLAHHQNIHQRGGTPSLTPMNPQQGLHHHGTVNNNSSQIHGVFGGGNNHTNTPTAGRPSSRAHSSGPSHRNKNSNVAGGYDVLPMGVPTPRSMANNNNNHQQPPTSTPRSRANDSPAASYASLETAKQTQLRHEIQLLEAQITATKNAYGTSSDTTSAKLYAINKKISGLKAELLRETREVNEVISIQRERDAQRAAVDEKRRLFMR